jgi:kinesin family protein 6/9
VLTVGLLCCLAFPDKRSVEFRIPRDLAGGYINNKQEQYEFKMNHIFDADATQADIFDGIGKKVVQNVLDGFNGTIFAVSSTRET